MLFMSRQTNNFHESRSSDTWMINASAVKIYFHFSSKYCHRHSESSIEDQYWTEYVFVALKRAVKQLLLFLCGDIAFCFADIVFISWTDVPIALSRVKSFRKKNFTQTSKLCHLFDLMSIDVSIQWVTFILLNMSITNFCHIQFNVKVMNDLTHEWGLSNLKCKPGQ